MVASPQSLGGLNLPEPHACLADHLTLNAKK
jgi:hypothetical protein